MKKNTSYIMICLISTMLLIGCNRNPGKTVEEKIDFVINSAYQRREFVGSALVAKQGKIVYQKNFGWSDKNNTDTISNSTKFLIASITKPITAILILKLAEDGKVKLTDSIGKLFNIPDTSKLAGVTVHQLLTHTSGIEELLSEEHELTEVGLTQARFAFDPGTDFKYSNTGYVILKLIAEKVS